MGRYTSTRSARAAVRLISLLLVTGTLLPATARASVLGTILASITGVGATQRDAAETGNLQTMQLLKPAMNLNPSGGTGGGEIAIVDNSALMPEEGPSGTIADIEKPKNGTISTYIIREGDTITSIARLFKVTPETILWANDLPRGGTLQIGQKLTILPVTGIHYTVKKGDTLSSIAKHFGGDAAEIGSYNGVDDQSLAIGADIIVPDGEITASAPATPAPKRSRVINEPAHNVGPRGSASEVSYYIAPLSHYLETQGIHGYNAVDLAAPIGTPIVASASGDVIVAKQGGWSGGYGSYVVIQHDNGSQTLYAHMSKVAAYDGEHVVQGQVIGSVGQTGKATGPHVHFEIRNGIRNPF